MSANKTEIIRSCFNSEAQTGCKVPGSMAFRYSQSDKNTTIQRYGHDQASWNRDKHLIALDDDLETLLADCWCQTVSPRVYVILPAVPRAGDHASVE